MKFVVTKMKEVYKKGFFHIFGSSFINKVLSFFSSFILVRIMSKTDYGTYSYALNIFSLFYLFSGLGMTSATLQLCSEKDKTETDKKDIFQYGFWLGILVNVVLACIMCIYALVGNISLVGAKALLMVFSIMIPLTIIYELQQSYFRYKNQNQLFSYFTTLNTVVVLVGTIIGAIFGQSLGLIIGRMLGYVITIIVGITMYQFPIKQLTSINTKIKHSVKKELFQVGIMTMINMATGQLLYLIDVYIIGILIPDADVIAGYKVATIIPDALLFIPSSLMIYCFPLFVNHKAEYNWVKMTYHKIIKYFGVFNAAIVIVTILMADDILYIVFGIKYINESNVFIVLMIAYFFSATFRKITGNVLVTQRKLKINLYIGIFEGGGNIVANIIAVKKFGAIGAAYATLFIAILSSIIGFSYMESYIKKLKNC